MQLQFVGSGDAFGSGGRFNTCIHVERDKAQAGNVLIDCGASSMIALRRLDLQPNAISTIVLSHLHGDHFGGIPFFLLDAQFVSKRTTGLIIAGPEGTEARTKAAMEVFFPGSSSIAWSFGLDFIEMPAGETTRRPSAETMESPDATISPEIWFWKRRFPPAGRPASPAPLLRPGR